MVKIIMHGCNGKMGQVISKIVKEDSNAEMVAGIDKYMGIANDYPVFESISKCDVEGDVIIDFSNASAVDELLDFCVEKKVPVVLCTTGLSEEQLEKVKEASKKVAVLKSANMSLGVNMLLKLLQDAAKVLAPAGYDIELVEKIEAAKNPVTPPAEEEEDNKSLDKIHMKQKIEKLENSKNQQNLILNRKIMLH